jgi:hypothetical protein
MSKKQRNPLSEAEAVVEEIRAIRRRLWEGANNDIKTFLEQLDKDVPWSSLQGRVRRSPRKTRLKPSLD